MQKYLVLLAALLFVPVTTLCAADGYPDFRSLLAGVVGGGEIEPTWESMAEHYQVPAWFVDGKIGVWMHWGAPSAIDENRPNDGSHYGRRMYGPNEGESGMRLQMTKGLAAFHAKRYGPPSEFGYEDLVPLFKAEKWDPEALVKFFKDCGALFTTKDGVLYAFVLAKPTEDIAIKTLASGGLLKEEIASIVLMGCNEKIQWTRSPGGLAIRLPKSLPNLPVIGFELKLNNEE